MKSVVKRGITSIVFLVVCGSTGLMAQEGSFKDKIVVGGNVWAEFGNPTEIYLAPTIGYKLTKTLITGVSLSYRYRGIQDNGQRISLNDYGSGAFVRNYFLEYLFGQAEYEYQNYSTYSIVNAETIDYERNSLHSVLLGGGISYPAANGVRALLTVLYNFSYNENGPYSSPLVVRGGVALGL